MSLTPYEKVCDFNKAFDYKVYSIHDGNPLIDFPKEAKYRYDLIHEEGIVELGLAFKNNDRVETMDGIADLLYVLYGACYTYNLNPDKMINCIYGNYNNFYETTKINIFNDNYTPTEHYELLIKGISELKECLLEKNNIIELYAILVKTIIKTFEFGFKLRININEVFNIVHNSNMSKLCNSEEEAAATVHHYTYKYELYKNYYNEYCEKYGVESIQAKSVYSPYDSPYYYKSGNYYLVKNKSTGKALKSINYTPVIL